MTRDEAKMVIKVLTATYPNYKPRDLSETVDIWSAMLSDYDYPTISKALHRYIMTDTTGFAPSIGQIIGMIVTEPSREPLEAWSLVRKAICNATYHADEEYAKLPAECQKAIGSPQNLKEMAQMDTDVVESVEQSHFIRSYQAVIKKMDDEKRLPKQMRSYTQQIAERMQKPKAIEVKESTPEPVNIDPNRESLVDMVRRRMEEKKNGVDGGKP